MLFTWLEEHWMVAAAFFAAAFLVEGLWYLLVRTKTVVGSGSGESRQILEELGDNGLSVVILVDVKSHIPVYVSQNSEAVLGIPAESIRADLQILKELLDPAVARTLEPELSERDSSQLFSKEYQFGALNAARDRHARLTVGRTQDQKYELITIEEISREIEVREGLQQKIVEVQAVDESKTVFLSKMSHEIRTPMNGMLGMISLARISVGNQRLDEVSDYLDKAEGLSKFLLSIINDILDMSRIESGKLELESAVFDVRELAGKIRTMFQTTIEDKGIRFEMELNDFTSFFVLGDELRISQVISNFLSNSSKFTPADGRISVTFRQMERRDGNLTFMIRVSDTGKGMSPKFLHRIFQPFEQEDSGIARKYGGSGLGMAISDSLVHMMGGQILVDSELGKGTTFSVFLTLPEAEEIKKAADARTGAQTISLEGIRVLMAEDNHINSMIAVRMLKQQQIETETAVNGRIALDMFLEKEPGYYDAILMDIHMPELDGWETTKQIRALERPDAKTIPIIALSADAFVEDKRHSVEIGMNAHVSKPIDFNELKEVLTEQISRQSHT